MDSKVSDMGATFRSKLLTAHLHYFRLFSQLVFLGLFLVLFFKTDYSGESHITSAVKFFLELDPLIALVVVLEHRGFPADLTRLFILSAIVIFLSTLVGRFFCGWICPLGTIHHLFGYRRKLTKKTIHAGIYDQRQRMKYLILVFVLICSLFSLQIAGLVDPLSLLIRSLTISVLPSLHYSIETASTRILHMEIPLVTSVSEYFYGLARDTVLPFKVYYFSQNVLIGILFILILWLNRLRPRFWCRFLCPLGAMLALFARFSRVQRHLGTSCNKCNICHASCQGAPAIKGAEKWNSQECLLCMNCMSVCPEGAISFSLALGDRSTHGHGLLPERRALLGAIGSAVITVPLLLTTAHKVRANPTLIRPPGALDEPFFLNRCIRCGQCMKVCPTNALHPTLLEAGLDGVWSPMFNMRIGYCEFYCTLCGQVCPTHAIQPLEETEKTQKKIGTAFIDPTRCLPFAFHIPCIVCEEHCPTHQKAIVFDESIVVNHDGHEISLKFPRIDPNLCIGCGICEFNCPVVDKPAIYVTSVGESRSEENKLIL